MYNIFNKSGKFTIAIESNIAYGLKRKNKKCLNASQRPIGDAILLNVTKIPHSKGMLKKSI